MYIMVVCASVSEYREVHMGACSALNFSVKKWNFVCTRNFPCVQSLKDEFICT